MSDKSDPNFPQGAVLHSSLRLVSWHPSGLLDLTLAERVLRFVEAQEQSCSEPFDRFADLSGLDAIHLSFAEVEDLTESRIASYPGPKVKTAILAVNLLAFGIARMYEQLMRRSPMEVGVFSKLRSAAEWLNVPVEILSRAP